MSNDDKKLENDSIRTVQSKLNELSRIIKEKDDVESSHPEVTLIQKYENQSLQAIVEDATP